MGMRRTTVFADEDDLAVIKGAAVRRGVAEAEIIRDAIHLAAMANRVWPDAFFSRTRGSGGDASSRAVADEVWADKAVAYERTKRRPAREAKPATTSK
jgi:hypothetical protein